MRVHRPTPATFAEWNECMSREYDQDIYFTTTNRLVRFIERQRMSAIVRGMGVQHGERVLDVGCGSGNLLEAIGRGERVGIDLSPVMVRRATERLGAGIRIVQMDGAAMNFPDASFDKVACSEVLEHVLDPHRLLHEIHRLLREGGTAVVSIPHEVVIRCAKRLCQFLRFRRALKLTPDGSRMLMPIENPWHLSEASLTLFSQWNKGLLHVEKVKCVVPWCPFHHVIKLRKL